MDIGACSATSHANPSARSARIVLEIRRSVASPLAALLDFEADPDRDSMESTLQFFEMAIAPQLQAAFVQELVVVLPVDVSIL